MTPSQEAHLSKIKTAFSKMIDAKYRAGAKEHGGNLDDMPQEQLLQEIEAEIIDLVVYWMTLKLK